MANLRSSLEKNKQNIALVDIITLRKLIVKMRKILFLITLFFPLTLFSFEISLKQKLAEAEPGSYLVTEQNKIFTFLHVNEKREQFIVLEEVVIPAVKFSYYKMSWRDWFQQGGPGHTGWTLTQINLETGALEEMFSFPHQGWVNGAQEDHFLTTLLNLRFKEVPDNQRRKIGLPPGYGKPDHRPLWNPRLVVEGKCFSNIPFTAWKARWPSDGSELSRKIIEVYLPEIIKSSQVPSYPAYFPFWMEVEGKIGSAKIRVVDSGTGVISPKPRMPRRPPELIGNGSFLKNGLTFHLKCPPYFRDFILIAEECDANLGKTIVLPCEVKEEGDLISLFVPRTELEKFMVAGENYRFSISPRDDLTVCLETHAPICYQQF